MVHITVVGMFMTYIRTSFISNLKDLLFITIKINGKCICHNFHYTEENTLENAAYIRHII